MRSQQNNRRTDGRFETVDGIGGRTVKIMNRVFRAPDGCNVYRRVGVEQRCLGSTQSPRMRCVASRIERANLQPVGSPDACRIDRPFDCGKPRCKPAAAHELFLHARQASVGRRDDLDSAIAHSKLNTLISAVRLNRPNRIAGPPSGDSKSVGRCHPHRNYSAYSAVKNSLLSSTLGLIVREPSCQLAGQTSPLASTNCRAFTIRKASSTFRPSGRSFTT